MSQNATCRGKYQNGPDQIIPAENIYTIVPDGRVKLKIPKCGTAIERIRPISVPRLLRRTAQKFPDTIALCNKLPDGSWNKITYKEYRDLVRTVAKAFLILGLERYHSVCILGFNSPEWFISNLAAIHAGGLAAGIYTTNSAEACLHCLLTSRANIVVVQNAKYLNRILEVRARAPELKVIVQCENVPEADDVLTWEKVLAIGRKARDCLLNSVLKSIAINECCTLIYTSGTTGDPKAVMLSHDNLVYNVEAGIRKLALVEQEEIIISYLPLGHVAAQIMDIFAWIKIAGTVYFADSEALKGSLLNTLKEVQPTRFFGVPRVWEKIYEKMAQISAGAHFPQRCLAKIAKESALQHYADKMSGIETNTWRYAIARSVILKRVKAALGMRRCKTFLTGAAPISPEIKRYFFSVDLPLMEVFGMSESTGGHVMSTMDAFAYDAVGLPIPGMKLKIHRPNATGDGEILLYGRNIFMGYLGNEADTRNVLDKDGWLHSGDIGRIDTKGFLRITGRLKELLITSGGENVPPVLIEQAVKTELLHINQCVLIGDKRKFLTLLITLETEVDANTGEPKDTLKNSVRRWLKSLGCPAATLTEVLEAGPDPKLLNAIQEGIDRANKKATSNAQTIKAFLILPRDFSIITGELGPTLKVKRGVVTRKYAELIDSMYPSS